MASGYDVKVLAPKWKYLEVFIILECLTKFKKCSLSAIINHPMYDIGGGLLYIYSKFNMSRKFIDVIFETLPPYTTRYKGNTL